MSHILLFFSVILLTLYNHSVNRDTFLHKIKNMKKENLQKIGLTLIETKKEDFLIHYYYKYKNVVFHVATYRYQITKHGPISIEKNGLKKCNYADLSKRFKSELYQKYLEVRYHKPISCIVGFYKSTNTKVKQDLLLFFETEELL